tara:strand:- start:283 stop:513 length:231 start_codon:yes stop_codon:yes gene_type:complete
MGKAQSGRAAKIARKQFEKQQGTRGGAQAKREAIFKKKQKHKQRIEKARIAKEETAAASTVDTADSALSQSVSSTS